MSAPVGTPLPPPPPDGGLIPTPPVTITPPLVTPPPVLPTSPTVPEPPTVPPTALEPPTVPPTVPEPATVPPTALESPTVPPTAPEPPTIPPTAPDPPPVPPIAPDPPPAPPLAPPPLDPPPQTPPLSPPSPPPSLPPPTPSPPPPTPAPVPETPPSPPVVPETPPPPSPPVPAPQTPPPSLSPPPPSPPPSIPSPSHPPPLTPQTPPNVPRSPAPPGLTPPPSHDIAPPPSPPSRTSTNLIVGVAIGGVAALAVFGLLWFLFARKKKKRDPYGVEGYYLPRDGLYQGSAQSGQPSNTPSTEHYSMAPPLAAVPSRSSSTPPQPLSTNGSGGLWSNSSGTENSIAPSSNGIVLGSASTSFTLEELSVATNGFSNNNLLGQGGFGYVHKGILPNGKVVAVKSLKADSGQGEREFQAEVETISRVHHKHLVSLVGYCVTGPQKLLVYEFLTNKTMEFHLHGKGQPVLEWPTRLKIAIGSAKGLAYLHEDCHPTIIHRDIKAANILLDFNFEALVADFGLAKFTSDANTHVSTRVMGTFGYMAPEYANSGKLTEKSDVFSFGVLLLELITGRRPVDYSPNSEMDDSLVDWARPLLSKAVQDGNFEPLVDPRLANNYVYEEMGAMITCAASCVRHSAKRRPRMSQVVRALEGNLSLSDLNDGVRPGFASSLGSSDMDSIADKEDEKKFRKLEYLSEDYGTGEFGRPRSEFRNELSSSGMQHHT